MKALIEGRFVKHFAFYMGFAFLNKGVSFLLIPLLTRHLTPEDYGIYALFLTVVMICEPFLSLCVHEAIANVYYDPNYDICEYVSTFLFFCTCMFILQITCLGVLTFPLFGISAIPPWSLLVPWVVLSHILVAILGWMWQLEEKPLPYGKFNFCLVFLQLFSQAGATVFLKLGWRGMVGIQGLLASLTIPFALVLLKKNNWLKFSYNKKCLYFGLKFGLSYIPTALILKFNDSIGQLLVRQKFTLTETGIYALGQKLGMVVQIYSASIINVYRPWLFKKLADKARSDMQKIISSVLLACTSILLFAWIGSFCVYIFSGFVLGKVFQGSLPYVFGSASACAFSGMSWVVSLFIYHTGKIWIFSFLNATTTILNILFTWYFLQVFGMTGIAYAPSLAWGIAFVLYSLVALKLWKGRIV